MIASTPFVLLALALGATAQSSSGSASGTASGSAPAALPTAGISQCIIACSTASAAANNCASFADLPCVCGSAQFQADANLCIETNCGAEQLAAAIAISEEQCGNLNITPSGTAGPAQTLSIPLISASGGASGSDISGSVRPTGTAGVNGTNPDGDDDGSAVGANAGLVGVVVAGVAALFAL
ncbi:hypothetical protein BKA70DRAFT_1398301 [Coprinopsis sp. MPI-PUGE-AT-0042]|nr:hypothetical protein BKA70DRAFT_1398301 [Coprinopsis sp. MPI-PUGE-AT-0042]